MTAAEPLETTRPIRMATLRGLRRAEPRHQRRMSGHLLGALVLIAVAVVLAAAWGYAMARWVG